MAAAQYHIFLFFFIYLTPVNHSFWVSCTDLLLDDLDVLLVLLVDLVVHLLTLGVVHDWELGEVKLLGHVAP